MPRVVASVEARMGSSRLPGKVLADVCGAPALERLLRRLERCRALDAIVLATTDRPGDDVLAAFAQERGLACFRGSEDDVLARVVGAQRMMESDVVVEICGDMTLLDPAVVDRGVAAWLDGGWDVVSTTRRPSYPDGADVQVFSLAALEEVADTVDDPEVREHVSLHFYRAPGYRILDLQAPPELRRPELRMVLDTRADLDFIRALYGRLEPAHGDAFGTAEIMALLDAEPALLDLMPREEP